MGDRRLTEVPHHVLDGDTGLVTRQWFIRVTTARRGALEHAFFGQAAHDRHDRGVRQGRFPTVVELGEHLARSTRPARGPNHGHHLGLQRTEHLGTITPAHSRSMYYRRVVEKS